MKVSLSWVNAYLEKPVDAEVVQGLLTRIGFPIESCETVSSQTGDAKQGQDVVLDVEVTSNRGDVLSHLGVAREIAAATGIALKPPAPATCSDHRPATASDNSARVSVQAPDLCPLYTARIIRGVKVGPSPAWLRQRLESLGLRSVNNVVDVTNFILLESGQPLHAFDLAKLKEQRIVVRQAAKDETFTAIDATKHKLTPDMLVIADAAKPVAIAGIMGGLESEVGNTTTDLLLESAIFAPLSVRQTSRALKLASDSSYRFERGIDPVNVETASLRAAKLIVEVAGGTIDDAVIRVGQPSASPREITMRLSRCQAILGIAIPSGQVLAYLAALGLEPQCDEAASQVRCSVPSHRLDLSREIDLIEEVGRLHGYDDLPVEKKIHVVARSLQSDVAGGRKLREALVGHGYLETVNFSFVPPALGEVFVPADAKAVLIDDERRKKEPMLRPSVLPSLLVCRKANQDAGNTAVRLFETAATWTRSEDKVVEKRALGLLADVEDLGSADAALRVLRGTLAEVVERLTGKAAAFDPVEHPALTAAASVKLEGATLGVVGMAAPTTQKRFELQAPVMLAELALEPLLAAYPPLRTAQPLARFPAIERDLSIVVDEEITWRQIEKEVLAASPSLLEELRFVTTYRGKPLEKGQKSVTLRLLFRDPAATLRHEQVDPQVTAVVKQLTQSLGATLRA